MLPKFEIPWKLVDAAHAAPLELARELSPTHAIYGRKARALASRQDCDDVLFELDDGKAGYATVHLTWIMRMESTPGYPSTELHDSLEEWKARRMIPDSEDWNS